MAHKKGVGSTKNGRDSESKRLGVKRADGQFVLAGNILVRRHAVRPCRRQGLLRARRPRPQEGQHQAISLAEGSRPGPCWPGLF